MSLHSFIVFSLFCVILHWLQHTLTACCLFVVLAGMEVAAALTDKAHSVSVIGIESVPFKKALGEKVGKAIMKVGTRSREMRTSLILKNTIIITSH